MCCLPPDPSSQACLTRGLNHKKGKGHEECGLWVDEGRREECVLMREHARKKEECGGVASPVAQYITNTRWRSTVNATLHKRAGWTHAAQAIREYGLARLEQPEHSDDATEHINALGQFVVNLAEWLKAFASHMRAYRQTPRDWQHYQISMAALGSRRRRTAGSD